MMALALFAAAVAGVAAIWMFTGRLFAPVTCGSGACRDCGGLHRLYQFGGRQLCRSCYDAIDGWIP